MSWLARLQAKAGTFTPVDPQIIGPLPRTSYDYGRDIRGGLDSNVVMAPVLWVMRNFTEAEPITERRRDGRWETDPDHEFTRTLEEPNPFYGGDLLWKASLISYLLDGNAYWQKVRNAFGEIVGLWYLPHYLVRPRSSVDRSIFIERYVYTPMGGRPIELPIRDVVHLRFGLDPRDPRLGFSSLRPLLREVFTDEEAANFSAAILGNMGVPGGVISPKDPEALPGPADVDEMKQYLKNNFTGDRRGDWLVLGKPTEIAQFGFDPNRLMLTNLRDITEERVCAMLGIPAAVVGFGAGLQQTKVGATMRELVRLAWISCITPMQRSIAKEVTRQLLPDFVAQTRRFRMRFDKSTASAFTEEETEKVNRVTKMATSGVLRIDKAQEMLGLDVDPSQRVYLRPTSIVAIAEGDSAVGPSSSAASPSTPSPNGNGRNGSNTDAGAIEDGPLTINRMREILASLDDGG